jgi:hypothetical protein
LIPCASQKLFPLDFSHRIGQNAPYEY